MHHAHVGVSLHATPPHPTPPHSLPTSTVDVLDQTELLDPGLIKAHPRLERSDTRTAVDTP